MTSWQIVLDNQYVLYDSLLPAETASTLGNPGLTLEVNTHGRLDFLIAPDHPYFRALVPLRSIIDAWSPDHDQPVFHGRLRNPVTSFIGTQTMECRGATDWLTDTQQRPWEWAGSIPDFIRFVLDRHNAAKEPWEPQWHVGNVTVHDSNNSITRSSSEYLTTWEVLTSRLIGSSLSGYLQARQGTSNEMILDYVAVPGPTSGQRLDLSNIKDLEARLDTTNLKTRIIPLGARPQSDTGEELPRIGIESVNGGRDYLQDDKLVTELGAVEDTVIFDDITVPQNLLTAGAAKLTELKSALLSIDLDVADLHTLDVDVDQLWLGYGVTATIEHLGIDEQTIIRKMSISLDDPTATSIKIGVEHPSIIQKTLDQLTATADKVIEVAESTVRMGQVVSDIAASQIKTYIQSGAPTSGVTTGDLWVDSDDGNKLYRYSGTVWVSIQDASIATAQAVANSKARTYAQATAPTTGMVAGDLWIDTANGNLLYRYSGSAWVSLQDAAIAAAKDLAESAKQAASGKVTTFLQSTPPTATAIGDLWIDTDDGNKQYRASAPGSASWVPIQDSAIATLVEDIADVSAVADSKVRTFAQTAPPTGMTNTDVGDLWIDTDDGNRLYRWSGTAWVTVQDAAIAAAQTTATTAQTLAASKIKTYIQTGAPTSGVTTGDLWVDSDDGNKLYRWSGTVWVSIQDASIATAQAVANSKARTYAQATAPTTGMVAGDLWMDTDAGNLLYRWSGTAWVNLQDAAIAAAKLVADTAQTTANSKVTTFYQTSAPSAVAVGDLWVDTDAGNKLYRASAKGSASWVPIQDSAIADLASDVAEVQDIADSKIQTYAQTAAPSGLTSKDVGDLWIDTDDGNKLYRWSGSAWVSMQDQVALQAASTASAAQDAANRASALAAAAGRSAANYVANPGAELDFDGWTRAGTTSLMTVVTDRVHAGTKAWKQAAGTSEINQPEVAAQPGQTWRFSLWFWAERGDTTSTVNGGLRLQRRDAGSATPTAWSSAKDANASIPAGATTTGAWVLLTLDYLVPATGVTHLRPRVAFGTSAGVTVWFDDVSLQNVTDVVTLEAAASAAQAAADTAAAAAADNAAQLTQTTANLSSKIDQTQSQVMSAVAAQYVTTSMFQQSIESSSTQLKQTADSIEILAKKTTEQINTTNGALQAYKSELSQWYRYDETAFIIGQQGSPQEARFTRNSLTLSINNIPLVSLSSVDQLVSAPRMAVDESMRMGDGVWLTYTDPDGYKHVALRQVG